MNRFISTLGLSTVIFVAIAAKAQAKEIEVTVYKSFDKTVTHVYNCDESSVSTSSGEITKGTGFSAKRVETEINQFNSCKLINAKVKTESEK